jgi:hypothetical protein
VRNAARRHFDAALSTRLDLATSRQDLFMITRIETYYLRSRRVLDRLLAGRAGGWLRGRRILRAARSAGENLNASPWPALTSLNMNLN